MRGLRQGIPYPLIYSCVVEAFIALIAQAENLDQIHGVRIAPSAPSVSTLCFADDTMIFCRATDEEASALKGILDLYAKASGRAINFDKSSMTFSKRTSTAKRNHIGQLLGVQVVSQHDKYLGMPAIIKISKEQVFTIIRDRVWKQINGWGEKTISRAGKEVLIKAVLQSIPTYIMSYFKLPGYLFNSIEKAIRQFWWGSAATREMAWSSWGPLCRSKA